MALIELDVTGAPDPPLASPPPAYRYRLPGLFLAAVLALALGGAAPGGSELWRFLGTVPVPAGPSPGATDPTFQLTGGRAYTVGGDGPQRVVTAWQLVAPPRRLWTAGFPARVFGPDQVSFGGVHARQAGRVVLLSDGPATTAVAAATGRLLWSAPAPVLPIAGARIGVEQYPRFRAGTIYDQDSGKPGSLYFSATGEPHTEPPIETEVRGVDLRTGATAWSVRLAGAVNVFRNADDLVVLSSDRLDRRSAIDGAVRRETLLPKVEGEAPSTGELDGDTVLVWYGPMESGHQSLVAYQAGTLERRWLRPVPQVLVYPGDCGALICSYDDKGRTVLDPADGHPRWRIPAGLDPVRHGGYVLEFISDPARPVRLVDAATGAQRVDLAGWNSDVTGTADQAIVLRRAESDRTSVFGAVRAGRDAVQPLGASGDVVSDCASDERFVVCRGHDGLKIWAYRA